MREFVSCIMATRNRGAFVRQAIRCFLRQTYEDSELIVVDDGDEPAADLRRGASRVRYLRLEKQTPVGTKLNIGVGEARGTILQKLDDDDYYAPDFLEKAVMGLATGEPERTVVAWGSFLVLLAGGTQLHFSGEHWAAGGTLCFHREVWRRAQFRDTPGEVDKSFLLDHHPNLLRVRAPESYLLVRHGGNTWTEWGAETVDQFFRRLPVYPKALEALIDPESLEFYRSLRYGAGR